MMLPKRDGWSILQTLRETGSSTPVICLTAQDAVEDRVRGLNIGADDYLTKPFAFEELVARVRAMIRRGHDKPSSVLTVGDLQIDCAQMRSSRGQNDRPERASRAAPVPRTQTGSGRLRTDIWEHIYDQYDEVSSNVVDVYIGYLRNKIDRDFATKVIHTRRGKVTCSRHRLDESDMTPG